MFGICRVLTSSQNAIPKFCSYFDAAGCQNFDDSIRMEYQHQSQQGKNAVRKQKVQATAYELLTNLKLDLESHAQVGEMFIVCGVLYGIDSVTERNTKIRLAIDLYRGIFLDDVNLAFSNPFKNTTMATYNHRLRVSKFGRLVNFEFLMYEFDSQELYTWDRGNQLTYPIRYNNITAANGSGSGERNEETVYNHHTGYESDFS